MAMRVIKSSSAKGRRFIFRDYFVDVSYSNSWLFNASVWYFNTKTTDHRVYHLFPKWLRHSFKRYKRLKVSVRRLTKKLINAITPTPTSSST
jgi:hypothetical protein